MHHFVSATSLLQGSDRHGSSHRNIMMKWVQTKAAGAMDHKAKRAPLSKKRMIIPELR
jgi:hypothetical protein